MLSHNDWMVSREVVDAWLLLIASLLRSASWIFLGLFLNQQLKYRSNSAVLNQDSVPVTPAFRADPETQPFLEEDVHAVPELPAESILPMQVPLDIRFKTLSLQISSWASIHILLGIFRMLVLILGSDHDQLKRVPLHPQGFPYIFILTALAQYGALGYHTMLIFYTNWNISGPTAGTRLKLVIAIILFGIWIIEPTVVNRVLHSIFAMLNIMQGNECIVPPWSALLI